MQHFGPALRPIHRNISKMIDPMKIKTFVLAAVFGCMCVAPLRAEYVNNPDSLAQLPDSVIEEAVAILNQFDGMEGLTSESTRELISHVEPFSLRELERFILHVRPKSQAEMEHEREISQSDRELPVVIVFMTVVMPLLLLFLFLGYRQRRKTKEEQMRQETLREMAKSGVNISPEVIAAVYGKAATRVTVHPRTPNPAVQSSATSENSAHSAPAEETPAVTAVYVEDPAETRRKTEKAVNNLILGAGFALAGILMAVFSFGVFPWSLLWCILFIAGLVLFGQGGAYLLTKVLTRDSGKNK